MEEIKSTILRDNRQLMDKCKFVNDGLNEVLSSVTGRFESFARNSQTFWANISMARFQQLPRLITEHHEHIGGVQFGLNINLNSWEPNSPTQPGNQQKRPESPPTKDA